MYRLGVALAYMAAPNAFLLEQDGLSRKTQEWAAGLISKGEKDTQAMMVSASMTILGYWYNRAMELKVS